MKYKIVKYKYKDLYLYEASVYKGWWKGWKHLFENGHTSSYLTDCPDLASREQALLAIDRHHSKYHEIPTWGSVEIEYIIK